jgi:hypothetical protein
MKISMLLKKRVQPTMNKDIFKTVEIFFLKADVVILHLTVLQGTVTFHYRPGGRSKNLEGQVVMPPTPGHGWNKVNLSSKIGEGVQCPSCPPPA